MQEKIILAVLEEIKIHALRFRMIDVTKRLHMSKTSLYHMVDSKTKLINETIDYLMERFNKQEQEIRSLDVSTRQKVSMLIQLYTKSFTHFDRSLYSDLRVDYELEWKRWAKFREEKINTLLEILQEGINKGELRNVNLSVMKECLLMVSKVLFDSEFLQKNNLTISMAMESFSDILFVGIEKK
ncbi:TetR/AcrR family transcriptional regulator [Megasphaera sueciensis]|uniref:TetR/AcrR family transcriptional regulator n=1 Tax=Megasphaera sueciensis TaxID=349094 RepID=UPI003D0886AE